MLISLRRFHAILFSVLIYTFVTIAHLHAQSQKPDTSYRNLNLESHVTNEHERKDTIASSLDSIIKIGEIVIAGNSTTHQSIIFREITFHKGELYQVSELKSLIETSIENLTKTSLFNSVIIDYQIFSTPDGAKTSMFVILLKERWFWWIWPLIEHPDRNFNEWWQHQNIGRLSVGLHFQHENFAGKSEKVNIKALLGYRTYLEASYEWPYLNKTHTIGLKILTSYFSQKEINFATIGNELKFYRSDHKVMQKGFRFLVSGKYRPGFHYTTIFSAQYSNLQFNDTIPILNSSFSGSESTGEKNQSTLNPRYLGMSFLFKADFRDNRYYPLKGYYGESEISHSSAINSKFSQQSIRLSLRGYLPFSKQIFGAAEFTTMFSTHDAAPYYMLTALGYNREFVRGYEYYVIEGQHYSLFKSHVKARLLQTTIRLPWLRSEKFNNIPLSLYTGPHFDYGIAYPALGDTNINSYQGKPLMGAGAGIDLVSYYDKVFRFEYSYNLRESKGGFFIHFIAMI